MANDVMLAVGDYRFSLGTAAYERLRRTWAWRWAQQDVLGAEPFQQYIGPGHTELVINGYVTPHFKGGLKQVDAMRAEADKGETLSIVDSLGEIWGDFVITGITETRRDIGPIGLPLRIEFQVTLVSTVVDRNTPAGVTDAPSAPAPAPPPVRSEPESQEPGGARRPGPVGSVSSYGRRSIPAGSDDGLYFLWSRPSDNGGSPIIGYRVQILGPSGVTYRTISGSKFHLRIPPEDLETGTYGIQVQGTNAIGNGPWRPNPPRSATWPP